MPQDWKNPIKKVKAPRLSVQPLEPISGAGAIQTTLVYCAAPTSHDLRRDSPAAGHIAGFLTSQVLVLLGYSTVAITKKYLNLALRPRNDRRRLHTRSGDQLTTALWQTAIAPLVGKGMH